MTSATIKNGEMLEIAARVISDASIQIRFSHVDAMSPTCRLTTGAPAYVARLQHEVVRF